MKLHIVGIQQASKPSLSVLLALNIFTGKAVNQHLSVCVGSTCPTPGMSDERRDPDPIRDGVEEAQGGPRHHPQPEG